MLVLSTFKEKEQGGRRTFFFGEVRKAHVFVSALTFYASWAEVNRTVFIALLMPSWR